MKKIMLLFSIILLMISSVIGQSQIAKIVNGKAELAVDREILLNKYSSNFLKTTGKDVKFSDVILVKDKRRKNSYFIVFSGEGYKSTSLLGVEGGHIGVSGLYQVTCTTTACSGESTGCVPSMLFKSCTDCSNDGDCTKTVTSKMFLGFQSY